MLKLSKLTDYAIVLLTYAARHADAHFSARSLSSDSQLPLPTVSKILKSLCRAELLVSHRGGHGGYSLARSPREISVADVIAAIEGPVALTDCAATAPGLCEMEHRCPVRGNWQKINGAVLEALASLSLEDMTTPLGAQRRAETQGEVLVRLHAR